MILTVVKYGHPMLRRKGEPIASVTPEIRRLIADMFETMYAERGIGLAAQQVNRALRLTVLDLRGVIDRPSTIEVDGRPGEVADHMPLVLIDPEIKPLGDPVEGPEGCLSFPEIYADVSRPAMVDVSALNEKGRRIQFRAGGLLARAVQHEVDHLNGILFIDRMASVTKRKIRKELDELQMQTKEELKGNPPGQETF
jgi:peptide deformylase